MRVSKAVQKQIEDAAGSRVTAVKKTKFRNTRTQAGDGSWCMSKKEARRWDELCLLHRAGKILHLVRQPRFKLVVNGVKISTYVADAQYIESGKVVIEDTKSPATAKHPLYLMKKRLVEALYGVVIRET